jgi:sugar lactone lactonase YvrE
MSSSAAKRILPALVALALILLPAGSASATPAISGTFEVPGIETNNKIVAGPDGSMWATVNNGNDDVARITPAGQVVEFELEGVTGAGGIAVAPGGTMWVTTANGVAKFSVADPKGSSKATEIAGVTGFNSIVTGPDGNLWVAANEKVVHFSPADPSKVTPISVEKLAPKDIDVAGGLIVVADQGEKNRLVTLTTAGVEKDLPIPGGSQGIATNAAGQIAFSAPEAKPEQAGLIAPPNPAQSFELLGDPFGVALGSDQAFWIAQFAAGGLTRLSTGGERSFLGGLPKETARQIAAGPGNTLWVTLVKNEALKVEPSVVRVSGVDLLSIISPPPPPVPAPETKIEKGPKKKVRTSGKKAKVSFRFSSTSAGATFQCALTKVVKPKKGRKAPQPSFKACKSPRSYRLAPGKYRFAVAAVGAGGIDPSAATQTFQVIRVRKPAHKH